MRGEMTFAMKDVTRLSVIQSLLEGKMVHTEAALALGLSMRQVQRMKRRVKIFGLAGILHGNRGRPPVHAYSPEERIRIITLAEGRYFDFNFSHLSVLSRWVASPLVR